MLENKITVAISSDFFGAFAALPRAQQTKVSRFVERFKAQPAANGFNYETINNARDRNLRSVRIDDDYRGIVLKPETGNVYVLLWVDKHDDAYHWAERKQCKVNPESGSLQIISAESVEAAPAAAASASRPPWPTAGSTLCATASCCAWACRRRCCHGFAPSRPMPSWTPRCVTCRRRRPRRSTCSPWAIRSRRR